MNAEIFGYAECGNGLSINSDWTLLGSIFPFGFREDHIFSLLDIYLKTMLGKIVQEVLNAVF